MTNQIDFSAVIGEGSLTLTHKHRLLGLSVQVKLIDTHTEPRRIPVAYEYLPMPDQPVKLKLGLDRHWNVGRDYPVIKIVAGPEVGIILDGFPRGYYEPSLTLPLLEIIRVQDPELIPALASDFNTNYLLGEFDVYHPGAPGGFALFKDSLDQSGHSRIFFPPQYFSVTRLNNGVIIRHLHTLQDLVVTVPVHIGDPANPGSDSGARFAYQINPNGQMHITEADVRRQRFPLVEIVKTSEVKVELARRPLTMTGFKSASSPSASDVFYGVYEAPFKDIPNQGEVFERRSSWKTVTLDLPVRQEVVLSAPMAIFDAAVRFLPVVGDLVDLAEFSKGWFEGRDLYGRKMSQSDTLMLGMGVFLPGALSVSVRAGAGARQLTKIYGRRQRKAADVFTRLKKAGLTEDDRKLFDEVAGIIIRGAKVPPAKTLRYVEVLNKIYGTRPSIDLLLNATGEGFLIADLQEAYRAYRKGTSNPLSPRDWAKAQTRGTSAVILRGLLGPGYRKAAGAASSDRLLNSIEVPRPATYTDRAIAEDLKVLSGDWKKLTERLDTRLPTHPTGLDAAGVLRAAVVNEQIPQGLLNILKGNMGEIFSAPIKQKVLASIAKEHPDAFLISGLRVDLLEDGKRVGDNLLFTDDVIARFKDNGDLQILGIFEVKAGSRGGAEATEQFFEWLEGRFTFGEGSRIVIPRGAAMTLPGKDPKPFGKALEFFYRPGGKPGKVKEVSGIMQAKQYMITASGASHLGTRSAQQTAPRTFRVELSRTAPPPAEGQIVVLPPTVLPMEGITAAEMDFLGTQILARFAKL